MTSINRSLLTDHTLVHRQIGPRFLTKTKLQRRAKTCLSGPRHLAAAPSQAHTDIYCCSTFGINPRLSSQCRGERDQY